MNRQRDIDPLVRAWLDEGDDVPPERYVWAALERIQTTNQRGAIWVSLEEHIMRAQPFMAAAVVAVVAIGLAIYFALGGGPNIGDSDATPTPAPGAIITDELDEPISLVMPDGWSTFADEHSVVVTPPDEGGTFDERIVLMDLTDATVWDGLDAGLVPWPDDLAAWLADHPVATEATGPGSLEVTLTDETDATVGGSPATIVAATTRWTAPPDAGQSMTFAAPSSVNAGTDLLVFAGEGEIRFAVLADRDMLISYHATEDAFSEATFQAVLDSIRFVGE